MYPILPATEASNREPVLQYIFQKLPALRTSSVIVFLLLIATLWSSCKQGQEEPPIPERTMQQILLDMHIAEAYSMGLGDSTNRFKKNYDSLAVFYKSVLKHYNISFEEFNKAMEWYEERPVLIDSLYGKVLNQLNELKAREGIHDIEADKPSGLSTDTALAKPPSLGTKDSLKKDTVSMGKLKTKPTTQSEK